MPTTPTDNRLRLLTCTECGDAFSAPRIGRPPKTCSEKCHKAHANRYAREYRRQLVRDREELAALRAVLRDVATAA